MTVEPKAPAEGDRKASFAYDYMGRRVKKESYARQASAWVKTDETRYLYDGWNMIRELNASGQTKKSYVWGIDLSSTLQGAGGIGGLVASVEPSTGTHAHYFFDGNGNVTQAVDAATGAPLAHYEYDPFGNVTYSSGPMSASNPYRFSTKYHDDETALVYYGYRFYSPGMGRWVNRDPIGEWGGTNLYGFVLNNPLSFIDILGLLDGGFGFSWDEEGFFMDQAGGRDNPYVGSGNSGKKLLAHLMSLTNKLECGDCIREYKIAGHGRHQQRPSMPSPLIGPNGLFAPTDVEHDFRGPYAITTDEIRDASKKGEVKFCSDCVIKIYGCNLATLTQPLSAATGCRVIAAGGFCSPSDGFWFSDDYKAGALGAGDMWYESVDGKEPSPIGGPLYDPNK